jgi:DNA-directed RNA polymerase specialized sigma24 family protein
MERPSTFHETCSRYDAIVRRPNKSTAANDMRAPRRFRAARTPRAFLRRTLLSETAHVHRALPYSPADEEQGTPQPLTGLLTHLDTVYGFALTLTGESEAAAELTEDVFASVRDDLWATLGGHGLRERLLARCVSLFRERDSAHAPWARSAARSGQQPPARLGALLRQLPWDERAAIALVDQLHSSYAASAAVLGVDVDELRAVLHRGRSVLVAAYRAGAR